MQGISFFNSVSKTTEWSDIWAMKFLNEFFMPRPTWFTRKTKQNPNPLVLVEFDSHVLLEIK